MNRSGVETDGVAAGVARAARTGMDVVITGERFEAFVVLDTIVNGRSAGGVRIAPDLRIEEVRGLAAEMSLKYALFDQPRGGAKAGVRLEEGLTPSERIAALEEFGRRAAPLLRNGIYSPGMDMNCGPDQLRAIYRGAGFALGAVTDTSWFTALSVHHALLAVVRRLGVQGRPVRLAVEGFGSVARHLAARLDPRVFGVVAASTIEGAVHWNEVAEPGSVVTAKDQFGDAFVQRVGGRAIGHDEVFAADVDVLLPSSRTWVLDRARAASVRARAVVPIANAPYAAHAVDELHGRGIVCLPGYLVNVGGVLASSLHDQGLSRAEVEMLFEQEYAPVVDGILTLAAQRGRPATEVTELLALAHMARRRAYVDRPLAARVVDRFVLPRLPRSVRSGRARAAFVEAARRLRAEIAAAGRAR